MPIQPPETFFSGDSLEIARSIEREDLKALMQRSRGVDLNRVHRHDMTFLFYALLSERYLAVTELVKAGADPQQVDKELGSPLDYAVRAPKGKALKAMLNGGVNPDATNSWGTPLLFTAACKDPMDDLYLLVERGADLDATDKSLGRTAVFEAFSKQCYDHVEYLIRKGAGVEVTLSNGGTLAYSLERKLSQQKPGNPVHTKLLEIKKLIEERGVRFPADPPSVVRARLKMQGKKVAE